MAIRHVVLFNVIPGADEVALQQIIAELNELPAKIDEIRKWSIRDDLGKRDFSRRFALMADFDSMDAMNRYLMHPEHVRVVEKALPLVCDLAEHDHET